MIGANQSVVQVRERKKIVTGRKFQEGIHTFLRSTYVTVHSTRQYPTVMFYTLILSLHLITPKQVQVLNDKPHEERTEDRNTDLSNCHTVTGYCGAKHWKPTLMPQSYKATRLLALFVRGAK